MSNLSTIVNAIILLPASVAIDGAYARQCVTHIERRGYELVGILNDWATALVMLRSNEAEVVVFARQEHFEPDWSPRIEFVGADTRELVRTGHTRPRNERRTNSDDSRNRRPRPA